MEGRVTEKKKLQRSEENKNYSKVNCTVELTNCSHLKATLAASLYCSFNFLVLRWNPYSLGFLYN